MTLSEVAEQTKIKASLLEGLERDDISQWPAGIFRRAYVRAYANAIGFDADAAVREFLSLHPEPVEAPEPPAPPRGLRGLVASALGSLRKQPVAEPTNGSSAQPPDKAATAAMPLGIARDAGAASDARSQKTSRPSKDAEPPSAVVPAPEAADKRTADLLTAARICTDLGTVEQTGQVLPLLREAAKVLKARGLIVWVWDAVSEQLRPAFVHGYTSKVRSRLRGVRADADNVTAAAFRAAAPLAKSGDEGANGALAVPLMTPGGCGGVLAIEVASGLEQDPVLRALATFFAAMLAQIVGAAPAEARADAPAAVTAVEAHPG
jgi:hypothetical protein